MNSKLSTESHFLKQQLLGFLKDFSQQKQKYIAEYPAELERVFTEMMQHQPGIDLVHLTSAMMHLEYLCAINDVATINAIEKFMPYDKKMANKLMSHISLVTHLSINEKSTLLMKQNEYVSQSQAHVNKYFNAKKNHKKDHGGENFEEARERIVHNSVAIANYAMPRIGILAKTLELLHQVKNDNLSRQRPAPTEEFCQSIKIIFYDDDFDVQKSHLLFIIDKELCQTMINYCKAQLNYHVTTLNLLLHPTFVMLIKIYDLSLNHPHKQIYDFIKPYQKHNVLLPIQDPTLDRSDRARKKALAKLNVKLDENEENQGKDEMQNNSKLLFNK